MQNRHHARVVGGVGGSVAKKRKGRGVEHAHLRLANIIDNDTVATSINSRRAHPKISSLSHTHTISLHIYTSTTAAICFLSVYIYLSRVRTERLCVVWYVRTRVWIWI